MATTPTLSASWVTFTSMVRDFMRDHEDLNRLIEGQESSNSMIRFAAMMGLDEFNTAIGRQTSYTLENFPSMSILVYLTIVHLLTSVGLLKARNLIDFSPAGFSVRKEELQLQAYTQWINQIRAGFLDRAIRDLKVTTNVANGWGAGVQSEYGWIHGWYGYT